jgi:hypothetical protein
MDFLAAMVEETFAGINEEPSSEVIKELPSDEEESFSRGVLFNTQIRSPFFVLKAYSTLDAVNDLRFLAREDEKQFWGIFETLDERRAAHLVEKFANHRFLISDLDSDTLDPGQDWWFDPFDDGFIVYFKRPPLITREIMCIGPLGEAAEFSKLFAKWIPFWETLFPDAKVSAGRGSFSLCGIRGTRVLGVMKQLFLTGESDEEFFYALRETDSADMAVLFEDVAWSRRFWLHLKNHLSSFEHRDGR